MDPSRLILVCLIGCGSDLIKLTDDNNFSYTGDVTIPTYATAPVMAFLTPTEGETNTEVSLEPGCGVLDFKGNIDGLMLGHYTEARSELQAQLLDLELITDEIWTVDLSGTAGFDLAALPGFTGFSTGGTWIRALTCTSCINPAPLFLTVLEPTGD